MIAGRWPGSAPAPGWSTSSPGCGHSASRTGSAPSSGSRSTPVVALLGARGRRAGRSGRRRSPGSAGDRLRAATALRVVVLALLLPVTTLTDYALAACRGFGTMLPAADPGPARPHAAAARPRRGRRSPAGSMAVLSGAWAVPWAVSAVLAWWWLLRLGRRLPGRSRTRVRAGAVAGVLAVHRPAGASAASSPWPCSGSTSCCSARCAGRPTRRSTPRPPGSCRRPALQRWRSRPRCSTGWPSRLAGRRPGVGQGRLPGGDGVARPAHLAALPALRRLRRRRAAASSARATTPAGRSCWCSPGPCCWPPPAAWSTCC